jgi:hypothetical protein
MSFHNIFFPNDPNAQPESTSNVMVSEEFNEQLVTAMGGCQIIMEVLSEDVMTSAPE